MADLAERVADRSTRMLSSSWLGCGSCISSRRRLADPQRSAKKWLGFLLACLRSLVFSPLQLGGLRFGRLVASDFLF